MKISPETVERKYQEMLRDGAKEAKAIQLLTETFSPQAVVIWLQWKSTIGRNK